MTQPQNSDLLRVLNDVATRNVYEPQPDPAYEAALQAGYLKTHFMGSGPMDDLYGLTDKGRAALGLPPRKRLPGVPRWVHDFFGF